MSNQGPRATLPQRRRDHAPLSRPYTDDREGLENSLQAFVSISEWNEDFFFSNESSNDKSTPKSDLLTRYIVFVQSVQNIVNNKGGKD